MKWPLALVCATQVFLTSGCSSVSTVSTTFDYDTEADFGTLRTYTWVPVEHDETISELVLARVESAVHEALTAKGYQPVAAEPDFSIHAHVSRRERTEVTDKGEQFDERGWAGYHVDVRTYEEGTLVLDVEDPTADALVWRGVARRAINTDWTPEQITERVREAVEAILAEFPPES